MNTKNLILVGSAMALLASCTISETDQIVKIGGKRYILQTTEVGSSSGIVQTYSIAEMGDPSDPIADCAEVNDCIAQVAAHQERMAGRDGTPELLRKPKQNDPLDPLPDLLDQPKETSFGD